MITIESVAFTDFKRKFYKGDFGNQRLGQAFYNHFNLHKIKDQTQLHNIHAKDGEHALKCIIAIVEFS